MSGHPADIRGAPKDVLVTEIEDIFHCRINADQVTAGGVQDSFRLSGGTAGVENVKGMFAVEWRRRAIFIDVLQLPVPPNIAFIFYMDFVASPAEHDHPLDGCLAAQRVIHISL